MNAEDFRKIINNKYKECLMDCQFPTGALADLNRAEFFAYDRFMENEKLKKDNANMRKTMRKIYDSTVDYYEKLTNCSDDSNNQTQLKKTNTTTIKDENREEVTMNTIPNVRAWDTGETEPWKQSYRKPAMLKVIKMGAGMEGVTCESNNIIGKGTLMEVHEYIALLDPPLMWGSGLNDKNGIEIFQEDIIERNYGYNDDGSPWLNLSYFRVVFENTCFGYYWLGEVSEDDEGFQPFYNEERELLESRYMKIIGNTYQNQELIKQ